MIKIKSIVAAIAAIAIGSCNSAKEGCYTSYVVNSEMQVAASLLPPPPVRFKEDTVAPEVMQKPGEVIRKVELTNGNAMAEPGSDFLALAAVMPTGLDNGQEQMRAQMVNTLKAIAGTTDSRFANRVLARTAVRLQKNVVITEKSGFMYRIKSKISQKLFPAILAAPMSGSDVLAVISLVTGILAFAYYAAFVLGVAAIVTGAIALARGTDRRGMAIVGIVFGAIAIALWSGLFAGGVF